MHAVWIAGGLGNQMFQYAFYKMLESKGNNIGCDLSFFKNNKAHNGYELENIFNIKLKEVDSFVSSVFSSKNLLLKILRKGLLVGGIIKKYSYEDSKYHNWIKNKHSKIVYFQGYWQSEKYFKEIEKNIRLEFKFPEITENRNIELLRRIKIRNSVSVHIRRGDYIGNPYLDGLGSIEYYKESIEYMRKKIENPIFLIFSNDIDWCKENLNLKSEEVIYVDWNKDNKSYRDMQLMSLCKHNIIVNSSFSWWGAWLNSNVNKIVIAPEKWFTDNSGLDYKDIVPENWIKIKNYE